MYPVCRRQAFERKVNFLKFQALQIKAPDNNPRSDYSGAVPYHHYAMCRGTEVCFKCISSSAVAVPKNHYIVFEFFDICGTRLHPKDEISKSVNGSSPQ